MDWDEAWIWEIIKKWRIAPHPCYAAGWNRCSCMMCIFSLPTHWAGIRELFPERTTTGKTKNMFFRYSGTAPRPSVDRSSLSNSRHMSPDSGGLQSPVWATLDTRPEHGKMMWKTKHGTVPKEEPK